MFVNHTEIHARDLKYLTVGEPLEFEIKTDPNGKKNATKVTGPNGAFVQGI
ncbi:cold shock domain-containing protein (plasmid) [Bacillus mycoides]|nr:cold shock domain-containing protein [Bacillus mycoides]